MKASSEQTGPTVPAARWLDLVQYASEACRTSVSAAITHAGYAVSHVDAAEWMDPRDGTQQRPTVLLLGGDELPRRQLIGRLMRAGGPATLGIWCCHGPAAWDGEILRACTDFLGWPCQPGELALRLRRTFGGVGGSEPVVDETRLLQEFVGLNMLGGSPVFTQSLRLIERYARCDAPVLVEGATGTGKELAARAVHYLGARRDYPFIAVNCGAIPDNLIENELFGHERGAFTDAKTRQPGVVEQANRGTMLLDEIDALSPKAQVTLLRFLERKEYRSLGGTKTLTADVRVIAATNTDLKALVAEGSFREDLLFRLNVLSVRLPLLRERRDDILLLAEHFIHGYAARYGRPIKRLHSSAVEWMMRHPWPGNVRELQNLLHRAFLLTDGPVIRLPPTGISSTPTPAGDDPASFPADVGLTEAKAQVVTSFERSYLKWLMAETGGNITAAARRARKERSALRRLLKKHGIAKPAEPR